MTLWQVDPSFPDLQKLFALMNLPFRF